MRLFFSVLFLIHFSLTVNSQVTQRLYGSPDEDDFSSILKISESSYIVSGTTYSTDGLGSADVYVAKISNQGDILWEKVLGGHSDDISYSSIINTNGNIVIVAASSSYNNGNNYDILLIELDTLGNIQWSYSYGSDMYNEVPRKINLSPTGLVLCASSFFQSSNTPDFLVLEVSFDGSSIMWQNRIGEHQGHGDLAYSIIPSNLGGYVLVGGTTTPFTNYNQIVMRLDNDGKVKSSISYGGWHNESAHDVIELPNNMLIVLGNFRILSGSGLEISLVAINTNNTFEWVKTYGDKGELDDRPYHFQRTADGGFVIVGYTDKPNTTSSDVIFLRTDNNGNIISSSSYGGFGNENASSVLDNGDGSFLIAGVSNSNHSYVNDGFIIKTKSDVFFDNCFMNNSIQNDLTLGVENFTYTEINPELLQSSVIVTDKDASFKVSDLNYPIKTNGLISFQKSSNTLIDNIFNFKINTPGNPSLISNIDEGGYFSMVSGVHSNLLISGEIDYMANSVLLMKYRNGFDAFQMENITTNRTEGQLWIDPDPYMMIASDIDLNDKVRANDITLLQQRIVRKISEFPQQLPDNYPKSSIDWRFIDKNTVDQDLGYKKSVSYPYSDIIGYHRDQVPQVPLYLSDKGSCIETEPNVYSAILLGDLVEGGIGINKNIINNNPVVFEFQQKKDLGENVYRVYVKHKFNEGDFPTSFDFVFDYEESIISIMGVNLTEQGALYEPRWLWNNFQEKELLLTSYSMIGYPEEGCLFYIDIYKDNNSLPISELFKISVFANGIEIPNMLLLKNDLNTSVFAQLEYFINLYPNPSHNEIFIDFSLIKECDINVTLVSSLGNKIVDYTEEHLSGKIKLDVKNLSKGLYICMIDILGQGRIVKTVLIH